MANEIKLLTKDEVQTALSYTENIQHLDVDIPSSELEFQGFVEKKPVIAVGKTEYSLGNNGLFDFAACVGIPRNYASKCPEDLLLRNLQFWCQKGQTAKLRLFLRDGVVLGCTNYRKPYYSSSRILEDIEKQVGANRILGYHKVFNSLNFLTCAVVIDKQFEAKSGDILYGGVEVLNSIKGEHLIEISPYVLRQVCINGALASESIGRWSHSRNDPSEIDVWAQGSARLAVQSLDQEFHRIQELTSIKLNENGENTIRSIFRRFGVPNKMQHEILARATIKPETAYDLYNLITMTASHSSRLSPLSARWLQTVAGKITKKFNTCPQCRQLVGN